MMQMNNPYAWQPKQAAPPPEPIKEFAGTGSIALGFINVIVGILVLVAQVGNHYSNGFIDIKYLMIPAFVPAILFLIVGILAVAAGVEKTYGLIMGLAVMSVLAIIATPISMSFWAMRGADTFPWSNPPPVTMGMMTVLLTYALLVLPIVHWVLIVILLGLACSALCCPNNGMNAVNPMQGGGAVYQTGMSPYAAYGSSQQMRGYGRPQYYG